MNQVDKKELKAIALRNYNKIPTVRGDDLSSFLQVILNWLAEWCGDNQVRRSVKPGYCAFVLAPDLVGDSGPEGAEETFYFKEDTTPHLGGNVYLTDFLLNNVWRYPGDCKDLSGVINILKNKGFAHFPFVAFDADAQLVFVFTEGTATAPLSFLLRPEIRRPFTIDVFMEMVADIYQQNLKYPGVYPPIWHDPKGFVPCKETELVIQGHVALILKARAQGSKKLTNSPEWLTITEKTNNAGRVDIAVYCDTVCIVVSELKVLRHCHFPCPNKLEKRLAAAKNDKEKRAAKRPQLVASLTNEKWAMRGVRQVIRYKRAEANPAAALLLYDMRKKDKEISAVRTHCITNDVRYARYYLYNKLPDKE